MIQKWLAYNIMYSYVCVLAWCFVNLLNYIQNVQYDDNSDNTMHHSIEIMES